MQNEILKDATPQVFILVTDEEDTMERIVVLAKNVWYERIEGQTGAVEFVHVADDEADLREQVSKPGGIFDLDAADEELSAEVSREFLEQTPLYPEAPELSDQWN